MSTSISREECIRFQRHVLKRIFAARLVDGAIADSVEVMGWPQLAELADLTSGGGGAGPSSGGGGGGEGKGKGKGTKRKNGGKEGGEKKEKVPHALSTYTLFVTLAMDMISQDPENPAFKVPEKLDENGQPVKGRGQSSKMTAASGLWSTLSEQQKAALQVAFKPVIDALHEEALRTGTKAQDVSQRVKEFKQNKLSAPAKQEIDNIFKHAMSANPRAAANASPTNTNHQAPVTRAESSDDVNSSEDSEEEVQPSQQQKQKELEAKLAQEAKDKAKKESKKEKKKDGGKKVEEGSSKKKKKLTQDSPK